ncbi:MAG TPA: ABC transporter ATP-binding protein [Acidimicrobiales bacterium]|jgi:ABC-2 type transport system ATP-binding protein|nr:ABC transporter ATP-binding protein [Acidimicrobiales bacterium]
MTETSSALEAKGLTKAYGDLVALEPLDLEVGEGELVMVVGPNGSGKTTFLRMAAGLLEASDGEVLVDGFPAGSLEARAALSYIPDNPVLYDDLTLAEHLHYIARLHGVDGDEADERGAALLEHFGLTHRADGLPATFSRGLRQKTSIALGLIRPFSVLCIDEPFVGLDQPGKNALLALLVEAHEQGATVVVATHSLEFVTVARRCVALRDGELAYDGPPSAAEVERLVS